MSGTGLEKTAQVTAHGVLCSVDKEDCFISETLSYLDDYLNVLQTLQESSHIFHVLSFVPKEVFVSCISVSHL